MVATHFVTLMLGCCLEILLSIQHTGVALIVKRALVARVDLVHVYSDGRLIVANTAVNSRSFRIVGVYALNDQEKRVSFFRRMGPLLVDSLWGTGMLPWTPN